MYGRSNVWNQRNLEPSFKRLLTNPEDLYKNFFRDVYDAYALSPCEITALLRKRLKGGYLPVSPIKVYMPKSNGLTRQYTLQLRIKSSQD